MFFDNPLYNEFAEAGMLNAGHHPWRQRRKPEGMQLAIFEIVDCSNKQYWYAPFVGVEFLGEIVWDNYYLNHGIKRIKEVYPVQGHKNVYYNHGRTIGIDALILK